MTTHSNIEALDKQYHAFFDERVAIRAISDTLGLTQAEYQSYLTALATANPAAITQESSQAAKIPYPTPDCVAS